MGSGRTTDLISTFGPLLLLPLVRTPIMKFRELISRTAKPNSFVLNVDPAGRVAASEFTTLLPPIGIYVMGWRRWAAPKERVQPSSGFSASYTGQLWTGSRPARGPIPGRRDQQNEQATSPIHLR